MNPLTTNHPGSQPTSTLDAVARNRSSPDLGSGVSRRQRAVGGPPPCRGLARPRAVNQPAGRPTTQDYRPVSGTPGEANKNTALQTMLGTRTGAPDSGGTPAVPYRHAIFTSPVHTPESAICDAIIVHQLAKTLS